METEFEEQWEVYPGALDENFAMFAVDLGVAEAAPLDNLSWLNIVRVEFESLPNGMPDPQTNQRLYDVEDAVREEIADRGVIPVGRMTTAGRRELFLYSSTSDGELLQKHLDLQFDDTPVETHSTQDPEWKVYFEFLYPTPFDFQRIHNQRVVRTLSEHGDDPEIPRPIDHFAYFPTEEARASYREELEGYGFEINEERTTEDTEDENRFVLAFTSVGPVDLKSIDEVTIPLWIRADELGGRYDGWGAPVARGDEEE